MLHLGSIRGTSIDVDLSFLLLIAVFVSRQYDPRAGIQYALIWAPVLFLSVLVHELAHASTIGLLGFGSSHIVLAGLGGFTANDRRARPWQDLLISLAGPVSSFALAFAFKQIWWNVALVHRDPMLRELVPIMWSANNWWGVLNLIPVSPLDGGRALRSFTSMFLSDRVSFLITVWVAMIVGAGLVVWGVLSGWIFGAVLMGWYAYTNYQKWAYFRQHGVPGD